MKVKPWTVSILDFRHRMLIFEKKNERERKDSRAETEMEVVPDLELWSGGCWVILSFTHALVRVSRSGGTVSMSDKQHMADIDTDKVTGTI